MGVGSVLIAQALLACISFARARAAVHRKAELRLLSCGVCRIVVGELFDRATRLQHHKSADFMEKQESILALADTVCTPEVEAGLLWLSVDIQTSPDGSLVLVDKRPAQSNCVEECHATARACDNFIEEYFIDEHAYGVAKEVLVNECSREELVVNMCEEWTPVCDARNQVVPDGFKRTDYPFEPMNKEQRDKLERIRQYRAFQINTGAFGDGQRFVQAENMERELAEEIKKSRAPPPSTINDSTNLFSPPV